MTRFYVWDPLNGDEDGADVHEASDAESAARGYLESYDASDGYPDELLVRPELGQVIRVGVTVYYEPAFYVRAKPGEPIP